MDDDVPSPNQLLAMALLVEGGMGLLALGLARWHGQVLICSADWSWRNLGLGAAAGLPMLLLLAATLKVPLRPLRELLRVMDGYVVPLFRRCRWPQLATVSILAGFGEEMLFRGVVQVSIGHWTATWIGKTASAWVGIVVAAALFGLLHRITTTYAVLAGLIGVYLGWLLMATGNLVIPIAAHASYDFVALLYLVNFRARPVREGSS